MKLGILDRLELPMLLPEKGNRLTMKALDSIREKVGFTAEELEEFELKTNEAGQVQWSIKKAKEVDIPLTKAELKIIDENYLKLSDQESLTRRLYLIGEKIHKEIGEDE